MWDRDRIIDSSVWVISLLLLILFIPKQKRRGACISFMFMQLPAWILGLIVVELDWISYPKRFLATAMSTSFTFEYCAFPTLSALYNVHYPAKKPRWMRWGYAMAFPSLLSAAEYVIEQHTSLILYLHWAWYWTWISVACILQLSYRFYVWFLQPSVKRELT